MTWLDALERFQDEGLDGLREGDLEELLGYRIAKRIEKPGLIELEVDTDDLDGIVAWAETVATDYALLLAILDGEAEVRWDEKSQSPVFRRAAR